MSNLSIESIESLESSGIEFDPSTVPSNIDDRWYRVDFPNGYYQVRNLHMQEPPFLAVLGKITSYLALKENWDSYRAAKINPYIAADALEFLAKNKSISFSIPHAVALPNGCVQLEWHINGVDLEIEFLGENQISVFCENMNTGDILEDEISFEDSKIPKLLKLVT